jgi:hemoglobin
MPDLDSIRSTRRDHSGGSARRDSDRRELDGSITWDELHPLTKQALSRRRFLGTSGKASILLFGAFSLALAGCGDDDDDSASDTTAAPAPAGGTELVLYERLGGNAAITAVVEDFVTNQVAPDPRINSFFANTDLTRLKALLVEQIGEATGGPEVYSGRDMKTAHAGLGITVEHFNALVEDLGKSLTVFEVPAAEQGELVAILAPLQPDIVTA